MPKITLTVSPRFNGTVEIPCPGEKPVKVEFTFKHQTVDEFNALMERTKKEVEGGDKSAGDVPFLLQFVEGWNLDRDFNAENLGWLLQNWHAAGSAISSRYTELLVLGRLGN